MRVAHMGIDTRELMNRISRAEDVKSFIKKHENEFLDLTPLEYLRQILSESGMRLSDVAKRSGQGEYVYKVFRGERKPSRDVLIAIAIGMRLEIDRIQMLMRISKLAPLDVRDKRDSIILYSINERLEINRINDLLYELNQETL